MHLLQPAFATAAFVAAFIALPLACDDDASGTTGRRVALEVTIAASADSRAFTNLEGWSVTIDEAAIATGALYFYDGETLFAARRGSWIRAAHAHPGHYAAGSAKGQLLTPSSADLLAGGSLGVGDGVSGFFRSATFAFGAPPVGPAAGRLGTAVIALAGKATKDGVTKAFRFDASADEMQDAAGMPRIEGCPFVPVDVASDGVVAIAVSLPLWFAHVPFDDVPDGETPVELPEGPARNQLLRGAKGGRPYVFRFSPRP